MCMCVCVCAAQVVLMRMTRLPMGGVFPQKGTLEFHCAFAFGAAVGAPPSMTVPSGAAVGRDPLRPLRRRLPSRRLGTS